MPISLSMNSATSAICDCSLSLFDAARWYPPKSSAPMKMKNITLVSSMSSIADCARMVSSTDGDVHGASRRLNAYTFLSRAEGARPERALEAHGGKKNHFPAAGQRSEEHTSELQSQSNLVCRLLL